MKRTDTLDELMQEVPGLEGYSGRIIDKIFSQTAVNHDTKKPLNTAFYHRWYRTRDGVGHRSFADTTLFLARNNHNRVLKMRARYCKGELEIRSSLLAYSIVPPATSRIKINQLCPLCDRTEAWRKASEPVCMASLVTKY